MTSDTKVATWLLLCCTAVFAMVILGGVTRLTGSGLSMVNWKFTGSLPPMTQTEWQKEFGHYKQSPEYKKINYHMNVDDFKQIFWFEYSHRMLGRFIGLLFFLPMLYFFLTRQVRSGLAWKLFAMLVLGGLQGLMGWYMVKSGLMDNPHVSQYRLTAHLALALLIYAYMLWVAWGLLSPPHAGERTTPRSVRPLSFILLALVAVTVFSGGFVAGLKAGRVYNTFPLMDGHLFPPGLFVLEPWWKSLFEDITTVQFNHRVLAVTLFCLICMWWWRVRNIALHRGAQLAFHLLLVAAVIQVSLGISTLLLSVPVALAASHQAGALVLFTAALFAAHQVRGYP